MKIKQVAKRNFDLIQNLSVSTIELMLIDLFYAYQKGADSRPKLLKKILKIIKPFNVAPYKKGIYCRTTSVIEFYIDKDLVRVLYYILKHHRPYPYVLPKIFWKQLIKKGLNIPLKELLK